MERRRGASSELTTDGRESLHSLRQRRGAGGGGRRRGGGREGGREEGPREGGRQEGRKREQARGLSSARRDEALPRRASRAGSASCLLLVLPRRAPRVAGAREWALITHSSSARHESVGALVSTRALSTEHSCARDVRARSRAVSAPQAAQAAGRRPRTGLCRWTAVIAPRDGCERIGAPLCTLLWATYLAVRVGGRRSPVTTRTLDVRAAAAEDAAQSAAEGPCRRGAARADGWLQEAR